MLTRSASAPGKILVAGEYVVLDAAPAIVLAVDRRARAAITAGTGAPPAGDGRLLDAVCTTLAVLAPAGLVLDSGAFSTPVEGRPVKLGLGSSAALAVALCRLLLPPGAGRDALFEAAFAAHRRFQGGAGSGADVAASVAGGVVQYRLAAAGGSEIAPRPWPAGLAWAAWWSGVPASTTERVARFVASGRSAERERLAANAAAVAEAWTGAAAPLLGTLGDYVDALDAFDHRHDLGIFAAGHAELTAEGRRHGVVYKPCGAGGGDVGIALATGAAALEEFGRAALARGFRPLGLAIDDTGAVLHECPARGRHP